MRLTVEVGGAEFGLRALTRRRMEILAGLAVGIAEAAGDADTKDSKGFGFQAGSSLETDNVGQQQEELWPDQVVISSHPSRRP